MTGLMSYEDVLLGSGRKQAAASQRKSLLLLHSCRYRVYIRAVFFFSCVHNCVSMSMFVLQKELITSFFNFEGTCTQEGVCLSVMAG